MNEAPTIGEYLLSRLRAHGVGHIFGIPGDYILSFYELLEHSGLQTVVTCDEQGAGFAADGYARLRGLGVVCVTYCVGGLKIANPVAGAYAEKSPVVVISGAPGIGEREKNPLLHHKVRDFDTQRRVFEQLTAASTVLDNPQTAFAEIDRVLNAALRQKRPVYIELPRDRVHARGIPGHTPAATAERSDPAALAEALEEAVGWLNAAQRPVLLVDVEVHRFGLQQEVRTLINRTGLPFATTILGKSALGEHHPHHLGIYGGAIGSEAAREAVEGSDCLLMLGAFMTDINLGIYTARLDPARSISATSERICLRYHGYDEVRFGDFVRGLANHPDLHPTTSAPLPAPELPTPFAPEADAPVTVARLFERLNPFLRENTLVVCDVGDALFGAMELRIHRQTEFLGPAYYASMGFAVPAALGAGLANPKLRPLVLVGDGAFQMTGVELSTIARQGLNPIVIVLNNGGYGTERHMQDGPYNDVAPWAYHKLPELLGTGRGWQVHTEAELESALLQALENEASFSLVEVCLAPLDRSPALERLASGLARRL